MLSLCVAVTRIGPERLILALQTQLQVSDAVQSFRNLSLQGDCIFRLCWLTPAVPFPALCSSQAGQGETIIKPCFLEMLLIARSDYDVVNLTRDEPQWVLLPSVLQPGLDFGKLLVSCEGRNVLGAWTLEVWNLCDVFRCVMVLLEKVDLGVAWYQDSIWYLSLIDGRFVYVENSAAASDIMSHGHFASPRRGSLTSTSADVM